MRTAKAHPAKPGPRIVEARQIARGLASYIDVIVVLGAEHRRPDEMALRAMRSTRSSR